MTNSWATIPLGEVITLQRGFDLPSMERRSGDVPVVSSAGITGTHDEPRVGAPGVVTGRYGTLGEVFLLTEDFWPLNTTLFVRDFKGNDPRFVSYLLRTLDYQALNDKSSVPGLNRNHLHEVSVQVPLDVDEQRAIAHILGTLDDKIELNRQMNQTLDEIARTLFRSWFVDFDPVRAKMEGREPYGMNAETAALFPDRLVDSELGQIPESWEIRPIGELVKLLYGKALKSECREPGEVVVMGSNGPVGTHSRGLAQGPGIAVGRKGNPGKVHWVDDDYWVIDTAFYVVLKEDPTQLPWWFYALKSQNLSRLQADSAVPGLNRNAALSVKQLIPPASVRQPFNAIANTLLSLRRSAVAESQTLANLRDLLLPELISGRRIADMPR